MRTARVNFKSLYYITHIDNVPSILQRGILSHAVVEDRNIPFTPIYDREIVSNRRRKSTPSGDTLWDFANLYFQPRNPMLYRVMNEKSRSDIVIIAVRPDVLSLPDIFISTGNAASEQSEILPAKEGIKVVSQMWDVINNEWWKTEDGSKRKIMAECLVPDLVRPEYVQAIYVANHAAADKVRTLLPQSEIPVVPEPQMFFQPLSTRRITSNISLVEGDMFFSKMQTLTISVNTVGIMGKGLASRAKYQFPDTYVVYQDVCRQKKLQMGKPYLYKRETYLDEELADDPATLPSLNSNKWFLLFATKRHWREASDINGIEKGLAWVQDNYKKEGVQSLAMPALGCGLGGLKWQDVGPLMCKYLSQVDINVGIYLPREQQILAEQLTPDFLLR
jgi:O-acetyl-ADP-ribose deacetylase (regulator of RNase III)